MREILFISAIIVLNSCVPDMTPPKSIIKSIKTGDVELEWFSRSASYVDVPDFVTATKGNRTDTICRATNVADVKIIDSNTIVVGFYGKPEKSNDIIQLPQRVLNYNVVTDTTYVRKIKS